MRTKFLAWLFAATIAVSGLVGAGPASAVAPAISTSSTIEAGQAGPMLSIDGSGFAMGDLDGDVIINVGFTGLQVSTITGVSTTQVSVTFSGTAQAGTITVTADKFAYDPPATESSNTLTIVVPGAPFDRQPGISINGDTVTVTSALWPNGLTSSFEGLRACTNSKAKQETPTGAVLADQGVLSDCAYLSSVNTTVALLGATESLNQLFIEMSPSIWVPYDPANDAAHGSQILLFAVRSGQAVWSESVEYIPGSVGGTGATPPPYTGPMITPPAGVIAASAGGKVTIPGSRLGGVSKVEIAGLDAQVVVNSDGELSIVVPRGLAAGVYDLVIVSDSGRLTVQGAIRVTGAASGATASGVAGEARPSTRMIAENTVKVWVFDAVGAGKVQIKLNGRELAWVNAVSADDPKLRDGYLVRTLTLAAGKNVIEVYVDGERVSRRVATGS